MTWDVGRGKGYKLYVAFNKAQLAAALVSAGCVADVPCISVNAGRLLHMGGGGAVVNPVWLDACSSCCQPIVQPGFVRLVMVLCLPVVCEVEGVWVVGCPHAKGWPSPMFAVDILSQLLLAT